MGGSYAGPQASLGVTRLPSARGHTLAPVGVAGVSRPRLITLAPFLVARPVSTVAPEEEEKE